MFLLVVLVVTVPGRAADDDIKGAAIAAHVKTLAHDKFKGRAAGSPGARDAAEYIAVRLRQFGLDPMGDKGTYFQAFDLPRGFEVDPKTSLSANSSKRTAMFSHGKDFKALSLSGPGDVRGSAVFCGYGIAAPSLGYDDYAGIPVKGKVVICLRHAPGFSDKKSPFSTPSAKKRFSPFQAKVATAVGAGAAALIVINDPAFARAKRKNDVALQNVGGKSSSIPVFHMTYRAGKKFAKVLGLDLRKEQRRLDKALKPRSRVLEGSVHVNAILEELKLPVRNILARLRAPRGPSPRETVVVGAHFDHVGLGAYGSLAGSKGKGAIHNGADDNASGTSSVLEIARFLAPRREQLRRDILFCWFTAEELGLLGSKHYVAHPVVPLESCVAMLNLDMVGRLKGGRLQVGGTGTSPIFPDLLKPLLRRERIVSYRFNPGGRAPSDNTSFYEKGMPVLFFFTGLHSDYHRPSDDWMRVDRKGVGKIARLAAAVALDLATRDSRPPFTRSDASGMSTGPHLGLSLEPRRDGVYVNYVEKGSPARRSRFKVGDKIEEFDGQPINSITNFNRMHQNTKPGQKIKITVRRGPRLLELTVKLGKN